MKLQCLALIILVALIVVFLGCGPFLLSTKKCPNCQVVVPRVAFHETLHTRCNIRYYSCPTASQAAEHAQQTCSNGHTYYQCSDQTVKTYHTSPQTCPNGHVYYQCSSEDTKNYHMRQEAGSCPDLHTYYRCNASDIARHSRTLTCPNGHSYYRCAIDAAKHRSGECGN